ncbi:MAG: LPS-assembly protein LptD [Treponema sp.]|nr:LPS-assembly protein LptD [Treponema sp.]
MSFGISSCRKCIVLISVLLFFSASVFCADETVSVITILSADSSEYKKNETTGEDEIRLSGNVSLSVEKGKTLTHVKAGFVTYSRSSQMMYARENVTIEKAGDGNSSQMICAETVLLNTSTLEGIFDGGRTVQLEDGSAGQPSSSALIVASRIFGRDSSGAVSFKNAELTFCDDENPHWRVKASRIWLLPGGEFAFLNAVVYVGSIPVLYLPAFYYPKDELLFNPSFGYSERLGYYFQTTTYLIGRKPLQELGSSDDENLSFSFMQQTSLKEQRREGLVLHNLDEKYTGSTSDYLKIMADSYANIGILTGIAGAYNPDSDFISSADASVQLGFTNTVFYSGGTYSAYSSEGTVEKDSASFLGVKTPFRYGAELNLSLKKPVTLNLSLPVYSDPYFTEDFEKRSEYLDWITFLLGSQKEKEDEEDTSAQKTTFEWKADASWTIPVPEFLQPFVSSFSFTEISSGIVFNSRSRADEDFLSSPSDWRRFTPERSFFYPSQVVPLKFAVKAEGTLFQYPLKKKEKEYSTPEFPLELFAPEMLGGSGTEQEDGTESPSVPEEDGQLRFTFPELDSGAETAVREIKGISYSLGYSVAAQFASQVTYDSLEFLEPSDFAWGDFYSTYFQVQVPVELKSKFSFREPFLTVHNGLAFNPEYQRHPSLKGYASEQAKNSVILSDYNARKLDLVSSNSFSVRPFTYSDVFRDSGLDWNTSLKVVRTEFIGDAENPEWDYITADLTDEESVTEHIFSATFAARESSSLSQKVTFSSNLPPQRDEYTVKTDFVFPYLSCSAEAGFEKKSVDSEDFSWKPFKQSASLKFFGGSLSFTESFNYELEERHADSMKLAVAWKDLQLAYTMQYTTGYDFEAGQDWIPRSEKEFLPYTVSLAYGTSEKKYRTWKNRITWAPALTTGVVYDCIRPTNSYFRFVPSLSFKIHDAFELTFSSESQNDVIFRYFQRFTKYKDVISGEQNMFADLWNSFSFWGDGDFYDSDQTSRRASGFKLKSLKVSIKRNLHDWDMIGTLSFKPRAITSSSGRREYDYHPYITFAISWHPMPSFKTEVIDEYGEWELK